MSLKRAQPGLRFALTEFAVQPDEIDRYETYYVINPSVSATFIGTRKSGTADTKGITFSSVILDYPRNIEFSIAGSSVGMAGTCAVTGKDQFGAVISESYGFGSADNGGTVLGTKIFSQITTGTVSFGTFAGANGTAQLGVGTSGTTAAFGLPTKLGGTTDVKLITRTDAPGATAINGGTIAGYVDVTRHAFKARTDLTGSMSFMVWYKPTYNAEGSVIANMSQRT